MSNHLHHDGLMQSITEKYVDMFAHSRQGMYLFLDDAHKVCNEKFSTLLGYKSPDEWANVETSFPDAFVAQDSQETLISAFQDAMEDMIGSTNTISWKKKDGSTVSTDVILVPIVHERHLFALHFVSPSDTIS